MPPVFGARFAERRLPAVGGVGLADAGGVPPPLSGPAKVPPVRASSSALQQTVKSVGAGVLRGGTALSPLKFAAQPEVPAVAGRCTPGSWEREQRAPEVSVLVEAVERAGRVVDQFDQPVRSPRSR